MRTTCVLSLVAAMAMGILGCDSKVDAIATTGATPKAATTMPPASDTYKVIGTSRGLSGYVVQYDEAMFRGGEPISADGIEELKKYGIKTIITITPTDLERDEAKKNEMTLIELPFDKNGVPAETNAKFLNAIEENEGPFYVHCHGGAHRAAILCMSWRIHNQGWNYDKAMIEFGKLGGSLKDDYKMLESIKVKP